mgnify:CR=1 FL=1
MKDKPTITKRYTNLPFGHRQPNHDGHCRFIHGHNWAFEFEFDCDELEPKTGFVVDFGKLKAWKGKLEAAFDHTLVLNEDDPLAVLLEEAQSRLAASIDVGKWLELVTVNDCSCEGIAVHTFTELNEWLGNQNDLAMRGVRCIRCTVFEDDKNSATFCGVTS